CTGLRPPSAGVRPSTVVTSAPCAWTANSKQERTASPSSSTVHAPHTPCSHPRWVPVRAQSSRRKSASVFLGSTRASRRSLFTIMVTATGSGTPRLRDRAAKASRHDDGADRSPIRGGRVDVVRWLGFVGGHSPDLLQAD